MTLFRATAVVALAVLTCPVGGKAQPGGPYAPLILVLPAGAKPLAMGNVGVASRDDDVLFYNPAQLAVARGTSGSFERYSPTSGGGTLSSVTRLTNSAVAIGVRVVDYKVASAGTLVALNGSTSAGTPLVAFPLDRGSSLGPGVGQGMSVEASLGYAKTLNGFHIGGAAKYAEDEVPAVSIRRATFDVGVAKDVFRSYTLAVAVQNVGKSTPLSCITHSEIGHDNCEVDAEPAPPSSLIVPVYLPLRTTLGASFSHQLGELELVSAAAISMLKKNAVNPAAGAELGYSWIDGYIVALRAGARRPLPGEGAVTAGAGLTMERLSVDYALETLTGSRIGHRVGLRVR